MQEKNWKKKIEQPDRLWSYFKIEAFPLLLVAVTGIIYNIGMTAGPYFEGQLAQRLFEIMQGNKTIMDMAALVVIYLSTILLVQGARCIKRFYVRRFANDTARNMRHMLYNSLVHMDQQKLETEGMGTIMTKAVADVDACVEGMRKFTTEIFDTGIVLIAYLVMLFIYDYRLTFVCCIFTPAAYLIAERLKVVVTRYHSAYKKSAGSLNEATMDRIENALTYRVYGREKNRDNAYEEKLADYEKKAVLANVWENTMQPIYLIISMTGVIFVIYFGGKNVLGSGWTVWNIASFTTFLSCFSKMAAKSSKAAKLFNAVQKARVSYHRLKPLLKEYMEPDKELSIDLTLPVMLQVKKVSFSYDGKNPVIQNLSFHGRAGEIIGVTGAVASGKTTLGKLFLCESPYEGSITVRGRELRELTEYERSRCISYMGHEPQLMSDTIRENILLGGTKNRNQNRAMDEKGEELCKAACSAVCLDVDLKKMEKGIDTFVGSGGSSLSGGQQARIALARTIAQGGDIWILDDPFSAVDRETEEGILQNLREISKDRILILISHRLSVFPKLDQVLFLKNGKVNQGTHEELMEKERGYRELFLNQKSEQTVTSDWD